MIRDYCGRNGIKIQEQVALFLDKNHEPQPSKR
jgi:hypothetical protein